MSPYDECRRLSRQLHRLFAPEPEPKVPVPAERLKELRRYLGCDCFVIVRPDGSDRDDLVMGMLVQVGPIQSKIYVKNRFRQFPTALIRVEKTD